MGTRAPWAVVAALVFAAPAGAGPLEEDLDHLGRVASRRDIPAISDRILSALRRRGSGPPAAFAQAESRMLLERARREPSLERRREVLARARERLKEALSGADEVASVRPALELAKLAREEAEAAKDVKAFEAALAAFEDLRKRLEKADDMLATRLEAGKIAQKDFERLSHEVFLATAEAYYEWGQSLLAFSRTVPMDAERRKDLLVGEETGAAARFDLAALMTESESDPKRTIYYPAPYLGKAESERAAGDREAARRTLRELLERPVDHPAGAHSRLAAMGMLVEVSMGAKEWSRAREEAEALRKAPGGGGAVGELLLARISAEESLAQREADPKGAAWRKPLDAALAALDALAKRGGPRAAEAEAWFVHYRSKTGEAAVRTAGLLAEARDLHEKGDWPGALARYRQHLATQPSESRRSQEPAVWLAMAECLHKLGRPLGTAGLLAGVVEHPSASEPQAAKAAQLLQPFWYVWLAKAFPAGEAEARSARLSLPFKRRMTERFPESAACPPLFYDLGEAARAAKDWEGALACYARVSASDADKEAAGLHLKALAKAAACRHALLLRQVRQRFAPSVEETAPLSEALRRFDAWLEGGGAKAEPAVRAFALETAVADTALLASVWLPEETLRRLDRYAGSLPAGAAPPGWVLRFRVVALLQLARMKEARAAWDAALAKGGDADRKVLGSLAKGVLVPLCTAKANEARGQGRLERMREYAGWVPSLLAYSLNLQGKPSEAEIAELHGWLWWQIREEKEHAAAAGVGEFVLENAERWGIPAYSPDPKAVTRHTFLEGLSEAYMGQEDWVRATETNRRIEAIFAAEGKTSLRAQERIAECAWRLAAVEKDPARRKEALARCYETYAKLWEGVEEGSDRYWDYALQMCRVRIAGAEHAFLMGFLSRLGADSPLGGPWRRERFAEAAARAAREGSAETRATAARFLERMWEAGTAAADPVGARLVR